MTEPTGILAPIEKLDDEPDYVPPFEIRRRPENSGRLWPYTASQQDDAKLALYPELAAVVRAAESLREAVDMSVPHENREVRRSARDVAIARLVQALSALSSRVLRITGGES